MWKFESFQVNHAVRSLVKTHDLMRNARDLGVILDAKSLWDDKLGLSRSNSAQSLWTTVRDTRF